MVAISCTFRSFQLEKFIKKNIKKIYIFDKISKFILLTGTVRFWKRFRFRFYDFPDFSVPVPVPAPALSEVREVVEEEAP